MELSEALLIKELVPDPDLKYWKQANTQVHTHKTCVGAKSAHLISER